MTSEGTSSDMLHTDSGSGNLAFLVIIRSFSRDPWLTIQGLDISVGPPSSMLWQRYMNSGIGPTGNSFPVIHGWFYLAVKKRQG